VKRLITSRYLFLCEWICLSTVDSNVFHGPIEFEITRVNCIIFLQLTTNFWENMGFLLLLSVCMSLFRAKFWRAKTSIACPYSRNDFKHIRCFCWCFFLSVKFIDS
jgi:hypothetical protein